MIRPGWAGKGWLSTPVPATVWQYALWEDQAMPTRSFDVVIIGGGNAGMGVTVATREAGLRVAMLEPDLLGGTCPNRGCMPKKVLVAAAHALDEIDRAKAHHIAVGGETLEAKHIVIATGSKPRRLPFTGAELMITSDDVLSERKLPASVVFIGGGVIALEFSHVYARAGAKVTILEALPRLLDNMDADAVAQLRGETERIGVKIQTGVEIRRIERTADRLRVVYQGGGSERTVEAERVVNGAGRVANVDGLDLAAGKVQSERGQIALDAHLRSTSNPAVYVCGDAVAETAQLSPIATYEGRIIGRNIVDGAKHTPDYASIPACVFTVPALASVGLTQAGAEEKGIEFRVAVNDMRAWLSSRTYAERAAWAKVLIEKGTDRVIGAHLVGHAGEELIHIFGLAMKHGITAGDLGDFVYGFPTFSADIKSML